MQVSPPDAHGFVSLGISVDIAMSVLRHAKTIVAEVNPFMPRTLGDTFLHVDRIDRFVRAERPLIEYAHEPADAVGERIARYVAEIIEDGATLHVDLGRIPNETLRASAQSPRPRHSLERHHRSRFSISSNRG